MEVLLYEFFSQVNLFFPDMCRRPLRAPIIVCSVANYRPHLSQFWANV